MLKKSPPQLLQSVFLKVFTFLGQSTSVNLIKLSILSLKRKITFIYTYKMSQV